MAPRTRSRSNNLSFNAGDVQPSSSQISRPVPVSSDESDVEKTFNGFLNAIHLSTSDRSSSNETDIERTFDRLLMSIPPTKDKKQCSQISHDSSSDESHVQHSFDRIMKSIHPLSLDDDGPGLWARNHLSNLDEEPCSRSKDSLGDDEPVDEDVLSESDERRRHHSDESFRDSTPERPIRPSSSSPTPLPENQGPLIHHVISTHLVPFFVILFFIFSDSVLHGPAHHVGVSLSAPGYP